MKHSTHVRAIGPALLATLLLSISSPPDVLAQGRTRAAIIKPQKPSRTSSMGRSQAQRLQRRAARVPGSRLVSSLRANRPSSDGQTAHALRQKADALAKSVRESGVNNQQYSPKQLNADATAILGAIEKLQKAGKLDPVTEHRAVAAAGRLLYAAHKANPKAVNPRTSDTFQRVMGRAAYRRKANRHETSVELETGTTRGVLEALTTKDGTVGPILRAGKNKPPEFLAKLANGGAIETVKWDRLNNTQKLELLQSQSKGRQFFSDRQIPGVVFRREIAVPGGRSIRLNNGAANDNHRLSVDGVLLEKVEYGGPKAVETVSMVEMHVRQPGKASANARDAFAVGDLMGVTAKQGHQHIPTRIPRAIRKGDSTARASLVDFYRRANMVGELRSVIDGYALKPVKDGSITYFDFLQADGLRRLDNHFESIANGQRGSLGESALKMGAVGFRTGELYKDPGMFGFEVRVLSKARAGKSDGFVDAIQKGVLTGSYGLAPSAIKAWQARTVGGGKQSQALANLHYNQSTKALLDKAPSHVKSALTAKAEARIKSEADSNYGLKMLLHDWSNDPALHGDTSSLDRVAKAQKAGLARLDKGTSAGEVTKAFVRESRLLETFSRSIGMDDL